MKNSREFSEAEPLPQAGPLPLEAEGDGPDGVMDESSLAVDEASLAVGVLLGFYRRRKRWSQAKLAANVSVTASTIAAFESAQRRPSPQVAEEISKALEVDPSGQTQLDLLIRYAKPSSSPKGMWLLPEDVLSGTPLFVRSLAREGDLQDKADISSMWIVTRKPLALEGVMHEVLKNRLLRTRDDKGAEFVYFIDSRVGEKPIRLLWNRLSEGDEGRKRVVCERLQFVLAPASLCLQHFGIANPGRPEKMFGRLILYADGLPVGFVGMDPQRVSDAYEVLFYAYERCKDKKGEFIPTSDGEFKLVNADVESSD